MTAKIHCKQDGWGWLGTCPHCYPSCPCGRYCYGPYLAGLDEQGNPIYSSTPVSVSVPDPDGVDNDDGYDDPEDLLENRTSEDGYIMWN
ncbi:hypothetical protein [Streptomyces sp. NPDC093269]|uniref:hypothetical protein n=1 Tax=Streptomyces sp. NPDC093269 TaxID=3366038 RepID=UPI0037F504B0